MSLSKENRKRRGSYCFICGFIDGDGLGCFAVNKKRLLEWEKSIPNPGLKIGSPICGRHFDVEDIIKGREKEGIFYSFKKWSLKGLAVPKHLPANLVIILNLNHPALCEFDTLHLCPCAQCLYHNVRNSHGIELRSLKCKSGNNKDEKQCPNCCMHERELQYIHTAQSRRVASLTKRLKANQERVQRFILHD